jgi:signal peptidase II
LTRAHYLAISAVVLLLDLWTKWLVIAKLDVQETVEVIPSLLQIVHVRNSGAAFGLGSEMQHSFFAPALTIGALGVLVVVIVYSVRTALSATLLQTGLHLIIGGAIGNLIDRFRFGYVVDFIDVFLTIGRSYHWPAFNIADAAICVGVALLFAE